MGRKDNLRETAGPRSRLSIGDTLRTASTGPRSRKLRSALSALGITIGIAALVSVLGLSSSSSADLIRELDALRTNIITVEADQRICSVNYSKGGSSATSTHYLICMHIHITVAIGVH